MDLLERQHARHRSDMADNMPEPGETREPNVLGEACAKSWRNIDAAFDRALSVDSRAFLAATTQYGGQ